MSCVETLTYTNWHVDEAGKVVNFSFFFPMSVLNWLRKRKGIYFLTVTTLLSLDIN